MDLAQRCLLGDTGAIREFVDAYHQPVFALCLRMLRHHQDAEDTAQESLFRALRYLHSLDTSQPLTPWVMKIAANRCRTNLGKRSRLPVSMEFNHDVPSQLTTPPGLGEELQLALEILVESQRVCFLLFYEEEMSVSEVARAMNVPEGTIKTWLHRSRKLLAQHLRNRGLIPDQRTRET